MRAVSQVLIATIALALGAQADDTLVARQLGQQPPPPRASNVPGQQGPGVLPPRQNPQPAGVLPPRQSPGSQPKQNGGLLGGLLGGNQPAPQPGAPQPKQGGLLGGLNQAKGQQQPKQGGGLLGGKQGAQPKQPGQPKQGGGGGLLGGLLGQGSTHPIAIKQCPATMRCRGRETACVPHPSAVDQFLCVKIDDDCGGRRNRACPAGQACLADPRDRDACVNGWCNNVEGICVSPPGAK